MRRTLIALALFVPAALRAQEPSGVYALSQVETPPRPENVQAFVSALNAAYPADKHAAGQGATVQVALVVGADGVPRDARVTTSTDAAFDSVTLASVAELRFTPATVEGRAVPVQLELPIQWRPAAPAADPGPSTGTDHARTGKRSNGVGGWELSDVDVVPRPRNISVLQRALTEYYPRELRDAGVEGTVQVRFRVDAQGIPRDFIVTTTTEPGFNAATLQAVSQLRFTPGQKDGQAVDVWVELPIAWSIVR
ncbi:energy transducer TonB [Longimicrobium sp.]|uniref:energy transducer TonB n=1 Tax=Longimicrobium sp. TaxID=2029185 RepID=UPI002E31A3B9|nr:energy transducer TonB [Longimicrobium sp.]HEX6038736.1 energy transducer TonB [Longimicrobium sp.]